MKILSEWANSQFSQSCERSY